MSLRSKIRAVLIAPPSHTEPLSRLDRLDSLTEPPAEDFAADSRAEVSTPKRGQR